MGLFNIKKLRIRGLCLTLAAISIFTLSSCGIFKNKSSDPSNTDPAQSSPSAIQDPDSVVQPPKKDNEDSSPAPESPVPSEEVPAGPDLAEREAVDDDYFADAAFMGNSLMDGFRMFSGLTTCDYYSATSMTVLGATSKAVVTLDNGSMGTMVQGLTQKTYGKIYILLGINEIGYEVSAFIGLYSDMLDSIIAGQPDCDIYIMGITPVSYAKSTSNSTFTMEKVNEYNAALHQLAADKGCYYMDLVSALAGPDGYLPADETTDGIHFSANVYKTWLGYVKTHYAN